MPWSLSGFSYMMSSSSSASSVCAPRTETSFGYHPYLFLYFMTRNKMKRGKKRKQEENRPLPAFPALGSALTLGQILSFFPCFLFSCLAFRRVIFAAGPLPSLRPPPPPLVLPTWSEVGLQFFSSFLSYKLPSSAIALALLPPLPLSFVRRASALHLPASRLFLPSICLCVSRFSYRLRLSPSLPRTISLLTALVPHIQSLPLLQRKASTLYVS